MKKILFFTLIVALNIAATKGMEPLDPNAVTSSFFQAVEWEDLMAIDGFLNCPQTRAMITGERALGDAFVKACATGKIKSVKALLNNNHACKHILRHTIDKAQQSCNNEDITRLLNRRRACLETS